LIYLMTLRSPPTCQYHVTSRLTSGSTINYQLFNTPPQHEHKHQIEISPSRGSTTPKSLPVPESPFTTAAGTSRTSADPRQLRHASSICMPSLGHHWKLSILDNAVMTSRRHAFGSFWKDLTPQLVNNDFLFVFSVIHLVITHVLQKLALLCFALASESCFYLFGIWERFRWSALQASSVKGAS